MLNPEDDFHTVGFNHETCPLNFREMIAIGENDLEMALKSLQGVDGIYESVILSTCNRTEIYSVASDLAWLPSWLANFRNFNEKQAHSLMYQHSGDDAARHVFRVASGLDSMVLGETQILGQLKNAVRAADAAGAVGPKLRTLFDTSFSVAKHIRTETNVGAHSVSLAAASVKVAERIFGSVGSLKVLFIGAGDMNRMCAEYFFSLNVREMSFSNRTLSRAKELADTLDGKFFSLSDVSKKLGEFDVVVSCTGSALPIVGKRAIERAVEYRRHRPILLIDLAVPRDIELEGSDLEDVFVYTVDDLGEIVKEGTRNRKESAREAEGIIEDRVVQFRSQLNRLKIAPVIKKFRQHGERIMHIELEKALVLLAKGDAPEKVVKSLSRSIANKFMDEPSRALNNDLKHDLSSLSEALKRLYDLDKN